MVLSDGRGDLGWRKYVITTWAFFECLLFAGILYGWSSLVFVFKEEDIYGHLCNHGNLVNMTFEELGLYNNSVDFNKYLPSRPTDSKNLYNVPPNGIEKFVNNTKYNYEDNATNTVFPRRQRSCSFQDGRLALCFTLSSAIFCASCVATGYINYKLGTRITRLLAFPFFIAGSLCFAFLSTDTPWLVYPGLCLIGIGGLPLLVTNTQVSNLFSSGSSSVVGLLVGGYDMSSAVFLVVKIAFQNGFSRHNMFIMLTSVHCMTLVSTCFFLPKTFILQRVSHQLDHEYDVTKPGATLKLLEMDQSSRTNPRSHRRRPSLAESQTLGSYLKQPLFITHNIWLCLLQLRFYYFIGNLNTYLNRVLDGDTQQVSYFTNVCYYFMMGGLVTSLLTGIVFDWQKRIFKKGRSKLYRDVMPAVLPLTVASILAIAMSILVLVPLRPLMYLIFVIMTLFRSFLYSMAAAFLSAIFPSQYFAVVYGITMIAAGVFSCFQYAFFTWAEAYQNAPFHADVFCLVLAVISLGHPLFMWITCLKEERATRR